MPPKRRAADEQPTSAKSPSAKRSKADTSDKNGAKDSTSLRRSPRKAAQQRQSHTEPEKKNPRARRAAGKKVGLKSWLSDGSRKDGKKIEKAVEAAVDVAEDAEVHRDEDEDEDEGEGEEEGSGSESESESNAKGKTQAKLLKVAKKVKEEQEEEEEDSNQSSQGDGELRSQVRAKRELQSPLSPKKEQTFAKLPTKKKSGQQAKKEDKSSKSRNSKAQPETELFCHDAPPGKTNEAPKKHQQQQQQQQQKQQPKAKTKSKNDMAAPLATRTTSLKHFIGAHVSIAKGIQNGVLNAHHIGANAFALFLKSQRKWDNPALQDSSVTLWKQECSEHSYAADKHVLPHGSYLVNLASQTPEQHDKSVASFVDDLQRCERLGIRLYNFHPGNSNGASKDAACRKIAEAINLAHGRTSTVVPVLETMASNKPASNTVGGRFEELAMIIEHVEDKSRIGVCIDTCHTFAAGYDIVSREGFKKTMSEFDRIIGRKYLRAWHLNDSKAVKGSGRDLHANIGTGFIGLRGFWNVMNMGIWGAGVGVTDMPLVLETPIDEQGGGMVPPKKGEKGKEKPKKPEEDKGIWAREIKLLESLIGMDVEGDEFKKLEKELWERGKGQREKMQESVDKMLAKGKGKGVAKKGKKGDDDSDDGGDGD